jgi:signal transduction histidine kinase
MNFFAYSALLNAFTSAIIGLFVLSRGLKNRSNVIFTLFAFAVSAWSIGYVFWQTAPTVDSALQWTQIFMAAAVFIPFFYFHFITSFLKIERSESIVTVAGYALAVVFSYMSFTPLFISGMHPLYEFPFWPIPGPFFTPFLAIWLFYVLYGTYILFREYRKTSGVKRAQILIICAGMAVGFVGGISNYFLWYEIPILPWGNVLVSFYVIMVGYAILKHRLFDIRVIATEMFMFALWFVAFFRLIIAQGTLEVIVSGAFLAALLIIGALLIRSVSREVEQREQIERLSEEKSEFMSFASHEIRNPITAMRGYASLIADGTAGEASPQVKEIGKRILVEGNEVLNLISQFLSKSKLELGQLAYAHDFFDMGEVVSQAVDGYVPHAEERGLYLKKNIDLSKQFKVMGDHSKVREVVGNLIDNSLKYTKMGGVSVSVEEVAGKVRVEVADTGVGIAADTIQHLFKKFSRADAQKMNLMGTGLGLYLGKTFIEAQGGKIWAESGGAGKGSTFIIEFPSTP